MYSNENLTMESCSDEQLCALAQQGDRTAEELLVLQESAEHKGEE